MMNSYDVYWLTRLDGICVFFEAFAGLAGFALIMCQIFRLVEDKAPPRALWLAPLCIFGFAMLGAVLTPSTKEMAAILVLPGMVNDDRVQEIGDSTLDLANQLLKEQLAVDDE
jgi:hypothetical protein